MRTFLSWLLLPVVLIQGAYVRASVPRLPEAPGSRAGKTVGASPAFSLLMLGESPAAGVGAPHQEQGLGRWTAEALSVNTGRAVRWRVLARNGATAHTVRTRLLAAAGPVEADLAVLVLGVNDSLRYRGPRRWTRDLAALVAALRAQCGPIPVVIAAVPPMHRFPALPAPLRHVLGWRSARLDRAAQRFAAARENVAYAALPKDVQARFETLFCADGFHPSPEGYRFWGSTMGAIAMRMLASCPARAPVAE